MGWTLAHAGSSASVDSTAYSVSRIIFHTRLFVIPAPAIKANKIPIRDSPAMSPEDNKTPF